MDHHKKAERACAECGVTFLARASFVAANSNNGRYCSVPCARVGVMKDDPRKKTALARGIKRFWDRVEKSDGCWLWVGRKNQDGYGTFHVGCKRRAAHRFSYELANGPVPAGMMVCHHCDNPSCVRPDHLFVGTGADNQRDMIGKGRGPDRRGEKGASAKLTIEQVKEIRRLSSSMRSRKLCRLFPVSRSTIRSIISGKSWKNLLSEK